MSRHQALRWFKPWPVTAVIDPTEPVTFDSSDIAWDPTDLTDTEVVVAGKILPLTPGNDHDQ
jgi:hypothetical protein